MHISRVELENFKSHGESVFEFTRGTTAIVGENGAGKTSIIEAIAWAMFDTLEYKKEEIVRRGEKKAVVRVTFESGLDEREYTIYRDTGTGYHIFDPRLKTRIADKKEEVTRFLWQHLGIEPGTDLESLFKHAIGVPQGTFTAIFLATAAERKKTFDSLLKVEEYRRSSDELLKTVRYVDQQIVGVDINIARAEGEIGRIDSIEEDRKVLADSIEREAETAGTLDIEIESKQTLVSKLDEMEANAVRLRSEAERLSAELARAELILKQSEGELTRSRSAAVLMEDSRKDASHYLESIGRLKELERERGVRQLLADEMNKTEAALTAVHAERKHLDQEITKIQKARADIDVLSGRIAEQETLEERLDAVRRDLAKAEAAAGQLNVMNERIAALREAYKRTSDELILAREKSGGAEQLETLQNREAALVREIASANAALERDERFQNEIKNGLCPILSQKCLNLKEGETLEGFISSQFGELRAQIGTLSAEQRNVGEALKTAREAERSGAQIAGLETRLKEIGEEGVRSRDQVLAVENDSSRLSELKVEFAKLDTELKALDNPKAKVSYLKQEIGREIEIRNQLSASEKNAERLESERRLSVEKLENYKDLDSLLTAAADSRDRTAQAYRVFVANEDMAGKVSELETAFRSAEKERSTLAETSAAAANASEAAARDYDRESHSAARSALLDVQKKRAEVGVILGSSRRRLRELDADLERLYSVRKSMQDEFIERERLKRISETVDFIRTTLKEAAPLVAKNYVHHVSLEANQLFREIGGNAERTLNWGDDYAITLEEGGYDRPFQSLSGGEQMAAAMSVRLALLKQLSDIRIAFFDEPTTNMDAERRENLAMQISQISHFDQLFVISHDDTFEGYMDNEVRVGE
ncbi:MAG: SMC family ATPase [Acidobacteria bacterium]|nr:SMC family ATPase [Acidobacteriota bacterium]